MPTIGPITVDSVVTNIRECMIKPREKITQPPPRRGVSIVMDETKIEQRPMYFKRTNSVGGTCHLHTSASQVVLSSFAGGMSILRALKRGAIHYGKEISVAAASCFGDKRLYPLIVAPTCKLETADDMGTLFQTIIQGWEDANAHNLVGPLWSFATDGDSTRCAAGYNLFVQHPLGESSQLYWLLHDLDGLNLLTGKNHVTLDFDFKHIFKRKLVFTKGALFLPFGYSGFSTLLRSKKGMVMNNGQIVNRILLGRYFSLLSGVDADKIKMLLYPQDPQNVPCAVELLQTTIRLCDLTPPGHVTPTIIVDMDAFSLLAELLESVLLPFTNVEMSLTEQIQSLSKYAHLSFTLFRSHRDSLMSNQLYGDSQTMVKNCVFCVAKQKLFDDSQPFYVFQLGTDRLEIFFGCVRMLGSHDSTMNYRQAIERFGHAVDIDCVLEEHPEWDTGARRLKMTRVEHVDHLNAESWKGNLLVCNIDLEKAWKTGGDTAVKVLEASQVPADSYNYTNLFVGTVDTLRPWGYSYPGVSTDVD
jgi:hypothetical protein